MEQYNKPIYEDVKRGEIYYISPKDDTVGSEQGGNRPAIIVSNDVGNTHSGIVEVVYLTTQPKKNLPTHVDIYTTVKQSVALCEQVSTISKFRLSKYINQCSTQEMEEIDNALMISLSLSKAKGVVKYMERWDKLMKQTEDVHEPSVEVAEKESSVEELSTNNVDDKYVTALEVQLEMYKKFYEDTRYLLETAIGGNK